MRLKHHSRLLAAFLTFLCLFSESKAADWLTLNPLGIEVLLHYDSVGRRTNDLENDEYNLEGGFRLQQTGYVLDPGLFNFSYSLEPRYSKGQFTSLDHYTGISGKEPRKNEHLGYFIGLDFLKGSILPVDGSLYASSSSQVHTGNLGQRSETDLVKNIATLTWKFRPFPTRFRFEERSYSSVHNPSVGSRIFIRDETEHVFSMQGRSSKTLVDLERRDVDDHVSGRENDFVQDRALVTHRLPWGRGSNLDSRFNYFDRTGFNSFERFELSENVRIHHTDRLSSSAHYSYGSATQITKSISQSASLGLTHRLYRNLTTSGSVLAEDVRSDILVQQKKQISLSSGYQKADFFGASVNFYGSGTLSNIDLESRGGLLEIVDESYQVPLTGEIILHKRFIATETIIVTDATSTLLYLEGVDYEIVQISESLTRLFVIPGGQIQAEDLLLISYKAAVIPSVEYNQIGTTVGFGVRLRGFGVSYYDNRVTNDVVSGEGGEFLDDSRNTTAQVDYTWDTARTTGQMSAERRFFKNGEFEITTDSFSQSLSYRLTPRTLFVLNLTEAFSETDTEDIEFYLGSLSMTWKPKPNWAIQPAVGAWKRSVKGFNELERRGDDTILSASLNVRWWFRKLSMDLNYYHNDRTTESNNIVENDLVEDRVFFNMRRRF